MSLYRRGNTWWIDLEHRGRRIRRSSGHTDKALAQDKHDELQARLRRARLISDHTWHDAEVAWLAASPRDDADKYRLRAFNRDYKDRPLSEVTSASIMRALDHHAAATFNRYTNLILAILNHARGNGWMQEVPTIPKRKTAAGRMRWLSAEEWQRLDAALPEHLRPLARLAIATGLRQANVTRLEWSQVDLNRRVLWIHADQAKARQAIGVPLSDGAMAVLEAQRGRHVKWVFPYRGHPIAKIKGAWQRALARAGLGYSETVRGKKIWHGEITWHDLRHTWASWHIMNGTPLAVLQQLGGWRTIQMVMRYAHLAPEHLAAAAGNARPVSTQATATIHKIA